MLPHDLYVAFYGSILEIIRQLATVRLETSEELSLPLM